jgi:hypothetical protein
MLQRERIADNVYSFQSDVYAQVTAGTVIGPNWAVVIDTLAVPEESLAIRVGGQPLGLLGHDAGERQDLGPQAARAVQQPDADQVGAQADRRDAHHQPGPHRRRAGDAGAAMAKTCLQSFMLAFSNAKVSDANQRKVRPEHTPAWIAGR